MTALHSASATNRPGRIAITGLGCVCAAGDSVAAAQDSMSAGRRAVGDVTLFKTVYHGRYPVCECGGDIAARAGDPNNNLTRTAQLALIAASEAAAQAGLDFDPTRASAARPAGLRHSRRTGMSALRSIGVCLGTTVGCVFNGEPFYEEYRAGRDPDMTPVWRHLRSNPSTVVARAAGAGGPCQSVTNACSSGTDAIGLAAAWIRAGWCDVALAGGADELSRISYDGFVSLMIYDEAPCRPFDATRAGLNLGEGAGVVVLEAEEHARARGAQPLAWLAGYGLAADAHHLTAPKPGGPGLRAALARALAEAGAQPADIGFVNTHGTGTKDNDFVESQVLRELFPPGIVFLSTKGYTGHTLGAAGGIEAVFTIAALRQGRLPASAGFTTADPELVLRPIEAPRAIEARYALSQSLAFGGNNSALVFERGPR